VLRLSRRAALAALAGLLFTACGSGDTGSGGVAVQFVGSDTCPTSATADGVTTQPYSPSPPPTTGTAVGQAIDEMPHDHVAQGVHVKYLHDPPTSGCHYFGTGIAPIAPGTYDQPIPPENWVHNLEHGYVAVLFNCPQKCDSEFNQLRAWAKSLPKDPEGGVPYAKVIVVPETTMPVKFAVVSWDWYLGMQSLDMGQVTAFYNNHAGHAPEKAG